MLFVTVIFLITCILTARVLEKNKMTVASIGYSVMFVMLFSALIFTSDLEPVSIALTNLMGEVPYLQLKEALLYALHSPGYGACIITAFLLTLLLQVAVSVIYTVTSFARFFKKARRAHHFGSKKVGSDCEYRELYVHRPINLLYCRMLN